MQSARGRAPGSNDDQGFGEPEDEVGKAERVLGGGRQRLEQVDMVEGDDAERGEGERLLGDATAEAAR